MLSCCLNIFLRWRQAQHTANFNKLWRAKGFVSWNKVVEGAALSDLSDLVQVSRGYRSTK